MEYLVIVYTIRLFLSLISDNNYVELYGTFYWNLRSSRAYFYWVTYRIAVAVCR